MSRGSDDWFRIAVHNLSRPCEVDYKCGPDRKCRIHEDPQVTRLQEEVRRLRAELDWRKMREELTSALLKWYEERDAYSASLVDAGIVDAFEYAARFGAWRDVNPKPPKPEDAPLPNGVAK